MTYEQLNPTLLGSGQPFSGELTEITTVPFNSNFFGSVFISNTSTTQSCLVRLAVKDYFVPVNSSHYILYDTEVVAQGMLIIPNLGLQSETQVLGYSNTGTATFNVSGDTIVNLF